MIHLTVYIFLGKDEKPKEGWVCNCLLQACFCWHQCSAHGSSPQWSSWRRNPPLFRGHAKSCCYSVIPCSADPHCFHHVFWLFCVPDFFPQIIHSARFLYFFFLKAPKEVLQEFAEKVEKKKSVAEDSQEEEVTAH